MGNNTTDDTMHVYILSNPRIKTFASHVTFLQYHFYGRRKRDYLYIYKYINTSSLLKFHSPISNNPREAYRITLIIDSNVMQANTGKGE